MNENFGRNARMPVPKYEPVTEDHPASSGAAVDDRRSTTGGRLLGTRTTATCSFVRAAGVACQAVAMTGSRFCYFHAKAEQRRRISRDVLDARRAAINEHKTEQTGSRAAREWDDLSAHLFKSLDLPPVEDAASYAVAMHALQCAVETQQISYRRGALLFRIIRACLVAADRLAEERRKQQNTQEMIDAGCLPPSSVAAPVTTDPAPLPHPFFDHFVYNADAELVFAETHPLKKSPASAEPSPGPSATSATPVLQMTNNRGKLQPDPI
jgi:hypothetical protein